MRATRIGDAVMVQIAYEGEGTESGSWNPALSEISLDGLVLTYAPELGAESGLAHFTLTIDADAHANFVGTRELSGVLRDTAGNETPSTPKPWQTPRPPQGVAEPHRRRQAAPGHGHLSRSATVGDGAAHDGAGCRHDPRMTTSFARRASRSSRLKRAALRAPQGRGGQPEVIVPASNHQWSGTVSERSTPRGPISLTHQ